MALYKKILTYSTVALATVVMWKVGENQRSTNLIGQAMEQTMLNQETMILKIAELEAEIENLKRL